MALTEAATKALLIRQVGEVATTDFPAGLLAGSVDDLWAQYADQAVLGARLRELYVKRGLIEVKLGQVNSAVDFVDGDHAQKASQAATALQKMLDRVEAQIETETEVAAGAGGTAAIGDLATLTPESPPTGPLVRPFGPKAEDPPYWPSPYYPERRRGGTVRRW